MVSAIHNPDLKEAERIKALKKYDILDTPPDGSFDHIVKLAAQLLNVPVAIISLVDTDRIWFKSSVGIGIKQIDRTAGLCASAILYDDLYVVENAIQDPRTLTNPWVAGEPGLRFYAAVPLKIRDGYKLGTLCVIDKNPRTLTQTEIDILQSLASILVDMLELRLDARKANTKQTQLLGIIAHELKNCLTTIPAYAELIKSVAGKNTEVIKLSNHILKASGRMTSLIREMLEMAQLQGSEIGLTRTNCDIALIVGRVATANLVLANAKQQKLYLDITDNVVIHADEMKISEIADNIINNAIKYSPLGSEIRVKVKAGNQKAILQVEDEGPGFTEVDQEKLFLPFTRLSARPTAGEHSTGMGLSIVKLLVEAHGGYVVAANNTVKNGAVITVELPSIAEKQ